MVVKFKKMHPDAVIPTVANIGDAGFDLTAVRKDHGKKYIEYGTGLAIEIPMGYVGLIFPRSSITKVNLSLANSVGVIDSGYRGEITFRFRVEENHNFYTETNALVTYAVGDRIGQIIFLELPIVDIWEVKELSSSVRGENGYGSSGH